MASAATVLHVPAVRPADALELRDAVIVDLRTPGEFAQDHLPGAVNLPLFDDVERALIGTLYKRVSREEAFAAGRRAAAARIEDLAREVAAVAGWTVPPADLRARLLAATEGGIEALDEAVAPGPGRAPARGAVVLYCWRGGLRSRSVASFLRALGLDRAVVIEGGYKAYRNHVLGALDAWRAPPTFVLRGLTGVGKTLVLRELEQLRPRWTLDLEALAGHRSSVLGMVGLEPCSQRAFESRLLARLRRGFPGPCVVEGESRKVGDAIQPLRVWEALEGGTNVKLVASVDVRVRVLIDDYLAREDNRPALRAQLPFIEQRIGPRKWKGELVRMLDEGREAELVEVLLEKYYDPLYAHSDRGRVHATTIDTTDPAGAAAELAAWIEGRAGPEPAPRNGHK